MLDQRIRIKELQDSLDWLKRTSGVDDDYLAQWDITEWAAWHRAMACLTMTPNPSVPDWLADIIGNDWSNDWSLPWPTVGQLWPTAYDWFAEHQAREDFQLTVAAPAPDSGIVAPNLQQLHHAWNVAAAHPNVVPLLMMDLLPPKPAQHIISGEISTFIVVASSFQPQLIEQLTEILAHPSQTPKLFDQDDLPRVSGLESDHDLVVLYELD